MFLPEGRIEAFALDTSSPRYTDLDAYTHDDKLLPLIFAGMGLRCQAYVTVGRTDGQRSNRNRKIDGLKGAAYLSVHLTFKT